MLQKKKNPSSFYGNAQHTVGMLEKEGYTCPYQGEEREGTSVLARGRGERVPLSWWGEEGRKEMDDDPSPGQRVRRVLRG